VIQAKVAVSGRWDGWAVTPVNTTTGLCLCCSPGSPDCSAPFS